MNTIQDLEDLDLIKNIYPEITIDWLKDLVKDYNQTHEQNLPTPKKGSGLEAIDDKTKKLVFEIFVSKTLHSKFAIKYRFFRFLQWSSQWEGHVVKGTGVKAGNVVVDLLVENQVNKSIEWVFFYEVFDEKTLRNFRHLCKTNGNVKSGEIPAKIIISASKSYRDVSIEKPIPILIAGTDNKLQDVPMELWIEEVLPNKPFNDDDLLIVNDLELAGFNFGNLQDLLDAVKKNFGKGQYRINRVPGYFSTRARGGTFDQETIWKGLILPKKIFNTA